MLYYLWLAQEGRLTDDPAQMSTTTQRWPTTMTGLILALGAALVWGAGSCPAASKPNILFILIDDMG